MTPREDLPDILRRAAAATDNLRVRRWCEALALAGPDREEAPAAVRPAAAGSQAVRAEVSSSLRKKL